MFTEPVAIALLILSLLPAVLLCRRTGKSLWLTLLCIFPFGPAGLIIVLWILAYSDWPREKEWSTT